MTEASWPFYGAETNEAQFAKWASTLVDSGIASGLAITAGTGMQVLVGVGSGIVRGVYYENVTDAVPLAIGAAPASGQTRRDYVVMRLDQDANTIVVAVKPGTASSGGGTLPPLTQNQTTWEVALAIVTVTAGTAAITNAMIDELKPSTGLRVMPYVTGDRPTPSAPVALGVDLTTNHIELWVGGAWLDLMQLQNTTGTLPLNRGGTGTTTAKQALRNLDVYVQPTAPSHKKGRVWIPGTAPD